MQSTKEIRVEQIQTEAYYLWEAQGRPHGRDQEFWFQAESLLKSRFLPQPAPTRKPRTTRTVTRRPKAAASGTSDKGRTERKQATSLPKRPRKVRG